MANEIAQPFHPVHRAIREGTHTHFWLTGGRGSTKSSFAAIEVVLSILRDPNYNAVCVRKISNTLRDSVYADILKAIDRLELTWAFHSSVSPMEIVYKPTGQRILFRGCDDPAKLKSVTVRTGYIAVVWLEEADSFRGMPEIRNILQSFMRGGSRFCVLYTMNPPRSRENFANRETLVHRTDRMVHHSTYLEVPREWLGETFFAEAEELKRTNEAAYNHEYLGDVTGTGGAVFENLEVRAITDEEITGFDRVFNGADYGFFPHPWVFERIHIDITRRELYVFDEATAMRLGNTATGEIIMQHLTWADTFGNVQIQGKQPEPYFHRELVTCDSAEPKSVQDYRDMGIDARPVKKWPGSVGHGIQWLQSLNKIIIDPNRAPLAAEQLPLYEYERTRDGEYCSGFPDENDDAIDAIRYAASSHIQRRYSA